ncbi:hypothetical protein OQZ33_15800 [Pedobacter sp. MC2016-05]|uniref:hypothetical protein n=1 Tax=Pedobacter sp. MC2016-05 TaxID=2994474 RepID=UPI002245527E|nr:hypothetical protein [Pedobacter sp. MC2016-05]MCX2475799.1 hypothetical protein [Pedobacter sp. MC2016-05]
METNFEISLKFKLCKGIEEYGCFQVGANELFAKELFNMLEGTENITKESIMLIDFIKWERGIPFPINAKHCTYDQLATNVKLITRELFKQHQLAH